MKEDSDKDQINKVYKRLNSVYSLLIKYNMWQAAEPRMYVQTC